MDDLPLVPFEIRGVGFLIPNLPRLRASVPPRFFVVTFWLSKNPAGRFVTALDLQLSPQLKKTPLGCQVDPLLRGPFPQERWAPMFPRPQFRGSLRTLQFFSLNPFPESSQRFMFEEGTRKERDGERSTLFSAACFAFRTRSFNTCFRSPI